MKPLHTLAALLCAVSIPISSAVAQVQDPPAATSPALAVGGKYSVEGRNADGSPYRGLALVLDRGDGNYEFLWRIDAIHAGIGKLEGNTMTVFVGEEHPAIYQVEPDGTLRGTWANGQATERMTPLGETRI